MPLGKVSSPPCSPLLGNIADTSSTPSIRAISPPPLHTHGTNAPPCRLSAEIAVSEASAQTSPKSAFSSTTAPPRNAATSLEGYVQTLCKEINFYAEQGAASLTPPITSIFFGGGTPSLLSVAHINTLLNTLQRSFSLAADVEITLEANPDSALRQTWLHDIRQAGINRLSLGVQSFFDESLAILGRCHTAAQAQEALAAAHRANFQSISLDLMWGLPWNPKAPPQNTPMNRWLQTLETALQLSPQHISAYGLILEEGTPLTLQVAAGTVTLPCEEEEQAMYRAGIDFLHAHGYHQYEISNYALPGHECRHNIGYWTGEEYLGFGPAAVSTVSGLRRTNTPNIHDWAQGIYAYHPVVEEETLTPHMLQEEKVMLSLRMTSGLALIDWLNVSPTPLSHMPFVEQLVAENLATLTSTHLRLTPSGMMVSNAIISRLFEAIP